MRRLGPPLSAALVFLLLAGCNSKDKQAPAAHTPPTVIVAGASPQSVPIVLHLSGTLQAVTEVPLRSRVTGYLMEQFFVEGTPVEEGAALYLIDPRPFQAQLDFATAQLAFDQANLAFRKAEEKRFKTMAAKGAASKERLDSTIAHRGEAEASIARDKANIELAQLNLEFTRITAPFAGWVQISQPDRGDLVRANEDILTTLLKLDPMYVIFNLSRRQLFEIQDLQNRGLVPNEIVGKLEVEVLLPNGKTYPHRGTLDFVGARIDPSTDTLLARATIPNPVDAQHGVELIAGQYVPVRLYVGTEPDALLIPQKAMMQNQLGTFVYVVGAGEKVESRVIEVGASHGDSIVVTKGLHKGERVIVDGTQKVREGMPVKAKSAVTPTPTDEKQDD
jgi:RND family efflux transporter MFP subunit